jgi:hypothetical protein
MPHKAGTGDSELSEARLGTQEQKPAGLARPGFGSLAGKQAGRSGETGFGYLHRARTLSRRGRTSRLADSNFLCALPRDSTSLHGTTEPAQDIAERVSIYYS